MHNQAKPFSWSSFKHFKVFICLLVDCQNTYCCKTHQNLHEKAITRSWYFTWIIFDNFDIIIHSYNIYKLFFLSFLPQINVISKKIWLSSTNKKKLLVKKIFFVPFTLFWTDRVYQIVPRQLEDPTFLFTWLCFYCSFFL